MDKPSKDACKKWATSRVTKYFVQELNEDLDRIANEFLNEDYVGETDGETLKLTHKALGSVRAIAEVLSHIDDLKEGK